MLGGSKRLFEHSCDEEKINKKVWEELIGYFL
jgi:hypothetical protein